MFTTNKERLRLRLKFVELSAYEKWKEAHPGCAKRFCQVEVQECLYAATILHGVRIPRDEAGHYMLDAISERGTTHERTIDSGDCVMDDE